MTHYKGGRKKDIRVVSGSEDDSNKGLSVKDAITPVDPMAPIDLSKITLRTQNCVNKEVIKNNIRQNCRIIKNWLPVCKPNDQDIVICSAGPSLNPEEIRPWYEAGYKIVAVKHALQPLLDAGIVPWACILLDPREHVEGFVESAHPDVNYFVASMVSPKVTMRLVEQNAKIFGYHAMVGANESDIVPVGHFILYGGSATATRGISLLEALGFRTFHLFGYDLCTYHKPDLQAKKENGKLIWEEITLSNMSYGGKEEKRTFWTKGEFLAQAQEFKNMYAPRKEITIRTYGHGMIPWIHQCEEKYQTWLKREEDKIRSDLEKNISISEYMHANGQ
jgi:hypothetical protein